MRGRIGTTGALLLGSLLVSVTPGCGESQSDRASRTTIENSMEETALQEVGTLYQSHLEEAKRPPKGLADFQKNAAGFPFGYDWLNRGDLIAYWGVTPSESDSGTILAYEKKTPKEGGFVLMQDGKTVKKMTAEEFNAAPKPAGSSASPKPSDKKS